MNLKSFATYLPGERKYPVRIDIFICVFLVLATAAVYWQLNTYEFIGYDDDKYVTENPVVQNGLTRDGLVWAFKSTHASNWHPLTWLSHMLDIELYGMDAGGHHLTSLIFHILNSLLLFMVFSRMTAQPWQSGVVALLFAVHPLHVESVAWVAERKDVLSTFWGLLALWSYVRYVRNPGIARYLATIVLFALGLMAKPMLVTLPFVMLLLDYWPLGRLRAGQPPKSVGEPPMKLPVRKLIY
ncbi:MAG: glycosyltransferase family 39 protein [Deltaproteobacteria bacterium]|jgi:hypothetical protein|nr:glycosyltransferase family 39 protein [Deltaproteobacteria bacterium]